MTDDEKDILAFTVGAFLAIGFWYLLTQCYPFF